MCFPPKILSDTILIIRRNERDKIKTIYIGLEVSKGKGHPCTGIEALYRPYGP
jgi:hypothetical protein